MARRTKIQIQLDKIEDAYWDSILLEGKVPHSVYALCKSIDLKEVDFYDHYASLDAIEAKYWESTVVETIESIEADTDYAEYGFEQKMLAFYYTYFAHIQGSRSRFVSHFPSLKKCGLHAGAKLQGMESKFNAFIAGILEQGMSEGGVVDRKQLNKIYPKALFEQFRILIQYYCQDHSEKFQDTDAFIEKTVKLGMDAMGSGVLDSAIDVVRFLMRNSPLAKEV